MKTKRMTPKELIAIRKQLGMSRQELATVLGVARQTIHRWEKDERKISSLTSVAITTLALQAKRMKKGTT